MTGLLPENLPARQLEILRLLAQDSKMKDIARALSIRPGTLALHMKILRSRFHVRTTTDLTKVAKMVFPNEPE